MKKIVRDAPWACLDFQQKGKGKGKVKGEGKAKKARSHAGDAVQEREVALAAECV